MIPDIKINEVGVGGQYFPISIFVLRSNNAENLQSELKPTERFSLAQTGFKILLEVFSIDMGHNRKGAECC